MPPLKANKKQNKTSSIWIVAYVSIMPRTINFLVMTKEDKIKEAYGEYWESVKLLTDENGFICQSTLFFLKL